MVEIIERVLTSKLLSPNLIVADVSGATPEEILEEESLLNRNLSFQHKHFLERWNGIDLEVIQLFCCGEQTSRLKRLHNEQITNLQNSYLVIGSDPSGFAYLEKTENLQIFSLDSKSTELSYLATNLDELFEGVIFGEKSGDFLGEDWIGELRSYSILK